MASRRPKDDADDAVALDTTLGEAVVHDSDDCDSDEGIDAAGATGMAPAVVLVPRDDDDEEEPLRRRNDENARFAAPPLRASRTNVTRCVLTAVAIPKPLVCPNSPLSPLLVTHSFPGSQFDGAADMYSTLFPRIKASPYLFLS